MALVLTTPLLYQEVHGCEFLAHTIRVSTWLIYLVDGEYHWYACCLSMSDSLLSSRHHSIVGSDDDDCDIGNLSTTGTHGGKRLVTRSIKECDATTILQAHVVSTDVLGDTTSLTSNYISVADMVEQ